MKLEDTIDRRIAEPPSASLRLACSNIDTRSLGRAPREGSAQVLESGGPAGQAFGSDPRLCELLTLGGVLDIARCGWLCRMGADGALIETVASVGDADPGEMARVLQSFHGLINLSNADQPFQWLAAGREYLICVIGHDAGGRLVLVLRARLLRSNEWSMIKTAARRLQRLVQVALALGGPPEPTSGGPHQDLAPQALADVCPFGVLIVDADQHVHLANAAVEALFRRTGVVRCADGNLAIADADSAVRFQVALRAVLTADDPVDRQTVAFLDEDGAVLLLRIARLPGSGPDRKAFVIITDPSISPTLDVQPLARVFALSPVETRLVRELARGLSLQEAARALHLKVDTARTYLKQIFQKTNTHRQLELVQLVQNGALPSLAVG